MTTPTPDKKTFPPSWRKWRKLRKGEAIRATDRVLFRLGTGSTSMPMGAIAGGVVGPADAYAFPSGWYFRKVS